MFPTAHSSVYYNEAGEPLGFSDESYYDPYDPDDDYDDYEPYDDLEEDE